MITGINIKLPFEESESGGVFNVNKTTGQALTDDLLCLMTTRRGNRVMRNRIYSPIYDYIDEPIDDITIENLTRDIEQKIQEFLPQIDVYETRITPYEDQNILEIKILFTVKSFYNIKQSLVLNIATQNNTITGNFTNA
jgi:phage baseplate assembly protein W